MRQDWRPTGGESDKNKNYIKTPSKWTCNFCPFKEEQELCGEGIIY